MPHVKQETTDQATTSSYATLLRARVLGFPRATIVVTNSHGSYSLKYKVLTSNAPQGSANTWAEEKAEATLAAGAIERYVLSGPFAWIDVQVVDATGGQHATANCWLVATGIA